MYEKDLLGLAYEFRQIIAILCRGLQNEDLISICFDKLAPYYEGKLDNLTNASEYNRFVHYNVIDNVDAFHLACREHGVEVVSGILKARPQLMLIPLFSSFDNVAIRMAAERDDEELVDYLLSFGPSIDGLSFPKCNDRIKNKLNTYITNYNGPTRRIYPWGFHSTNPVWGSPT